MGASIYVTLWMVMMLLSDVRPVKSFPYVGCYADTGTGRGGAIVDEATLLLTESIFPIEQRHNLWGVLCTPGVSVGTACQIHCLKRNTRYFYVRGLINGQNTPSARCYCDNSPPENGVAEENLCGYEDCTDVRSGGRDSHASVYKVYDTSACSLVSASFTDVADINNGISNTPARCRAHCLGQNVAFFGLRNQNSQRRCYCLQESAIDFVNLMTATDCTRTCDNSDIPCGGPGVRNRGVYVSIYTVCPVRYTLDSNGICSQSCNCPSGVCHPDDGSCVTCPQGLEGELCQQDVDECATDSTHNCVSPTVCRNTRGGFSCVCPTGYTQSQNEDSSITCVEIDECRDNSGICGRGTCNNTDGSYVCQCEVGFEWPGVNRTCVDTDECLNTSYCQHGSCQNTEGSFRCVCDAGYRANMRETACDDIDECTENTTLCEHGTCNNTQGSYNCTCSDGFEGQNDNKDCVDINECQADPGPCREGQTCLNDVGSFMCVCAGGFKVNEQGLCQDIDECNAHIAPCPGSTCHNTNGSFYCDCEGSLTTSGPGRTCSEYKGCYQDDESDTQLSEDDYHQTSSVFPFVGGDNVGFTCDSNLAGLACQVHCMQKNKRYFYLRGLVYATDERPTGNRCYCSDSRPGPESSDQCNYLVCGPVQSGGAANGIGYGSLYSVFDTPYCSLIPQNQPWTDVSAITNQITNVPGKCRTHCLQQNMAFFGLQQDENDAIRCYCLHESSVEFAYLMTTPDCTRTCDNGDVPCGGGQGYVSIYTVCPVHYTINPEHDGICSQSCNCPSGVCHPDDGSCVTCPQGLEAELCQQDINECELSSQTCPDDEAVGSCQNTTGDYTCLCEEGYRLTADGHQCEDIDECELSNHTCPTDPTIGSCQNTPGDYMCLCGEGYQLVMDAHQCQTSATSQNIVPIAVGVAVPVLVLVGLAIGVVFFLRHRKNQTAAGSTKRKSQEHESEDGAVDNIDMPELSFGSRDPLTQAGPAMKRNTKSNPDTTVAKKKAKLSFLSKRKPATAADDDHLYGNVAGDSCQNTKFKKKEFIKHVTHQNRREEPFKEEFQSLPQGPIASCDVGANPAFIKKNRFKNILPYDFNRVKLEVQRNDPLTDYINASCVQGYSAQDKFIASLGPRKRTLDDFWRMMWEHDCHVIVMLTNLVEEDVTKCEQYWPDADPVNFGELSVRLLSVDVQTEKTIRKIHVSKGTEKRVVTQIHFTIWPDHGVPRYRASLLRFHACMSGLIIPNKHTVVHCSAGIGRTGTMIALDYLLKQLSSEGQVDVWECVKRLREQRTGMVQTMRQYTFLNNVIKEYITVGDTRLPVHSLQDAQSKLSGVNEATRQTRATDQMKVLQETCPVIDIYDSREATSSANEHKNRDVNVLPQSTKMPKVSCGYINAVWINDCRSSKGYLGTQIPLDSTINDFWTMVLECNVHVVMILCPMDAKKSIPEFLPSSWSSATLGDVTLTRDCEPSSYQTGLTVHKLSKKDHSSNNNMKSTSPASDNQEYMNADELDEMTAQNRVTIYEHVQVEGNSKLISVRAAIELYSKEMRGKSKDGSHPVVVADVNGCDLCGQFIACCNMFEMIDNEKHVDVFGIVQQIKDCRPEFINEQEQYCHLHEVAKMYAGDFNLYGNV